MCVTSPAGFIAINGTNIFVRAVSFLYREIIFTQPDLLIAQNQKNKMFLQELSSLLR